MAQLTQEQFDSVIVKWTRSGLRDPLLLTDPQNADLLLRLAQLYFDKAGVLPDPGQFQNLVNMAGRTDMRKDGTGLRYGVPGDSDIGRIAAVVHAVNAETNADPMPWPDEPSLRHLKNLEDLKKMPKEKMREFFQEAARYKGPKHQDTSLSEKLDQRIQWIQRVRAHRDVEAPKEEPVLTEKQKAYNAAKKRYDSINDLIDQSFGPAYSERARKARNRVQGVLHQLMRANASWDEIDRRIIYEIQTDGDAIR